MSISLEDHYEDILGKAQRGLELSDRQLASRAGVEPDAVQRVRGGEFDEAVVRALAGPLGLGADALVAAGKKSWRPAPIALEGLAQFNTPFDDMLVNAYVVWDPQTLSAIAFDTGSDCAPMLDLAREKELSVQLILLTHTHGDHIYDLDRLLSKTGAPAFVSTREAMEGAESFEPGRTFEAGALRVETRLTSGHSRGGITYVVSGLDRPVAVVGDSIFAGSMGGGQISYEDALRNNREQILTLSDEAILCPGHGPMTTVGEEKANNPFFA